MVLLLTSEHHFGLIRTTSFRNTFDTTASYEAATALVTVAKQVQVVNLLARHVVNGLHSDYCILKQSALSLFTQLASSIRGLSLLLYCNRVRISVTKSLEQKDTFSAPGQPSIAEIVCLQENCCHRVYRCSIHRRSY